MTSQEILNFNPCLNLPLCSSFGAKTVSLMIKIYASHIVFADRGRADLKGTVWSTKLPLRFPLNLFSNKLANINVNKPLP